jgi:hypothetical protein
MCYWDYQTCQFLNFTSSLTCCGDKVARQCQTTQKGIIMKPAARLSFQLPNKSTSTLPTRNCFAAKFILFLVILYQELVLEGEIKIHHNCDSQRPHLEVRKQVKCASPILCVAFCSMIWHSIGGLHTFYSFFFQIGVIQLKEGRYFNTSCLQSNFSQFCHHSLKLN